jgi:hypothetical protein
MSGRSGGGGSDWVLKMWAVVTLLGIAFLAVAGVVLMFTGGLYITPQHPYYVDPTNLYSDYVVPYPPAPSETGALYLPVYAILHFFPNGSATAEAWVYNPNTVPILISEFLISPTFTNNNTPVWWGPSSTPTNSSYPPGTPNNEMLPFTFAYTNVWGAVYPGKVYQEDTLIQPGLLVNDSGNEYFVFKFFAESSLGQFNYNEPFVYVGNGTWVATPWTAQLKGMNGYYNNVAWQVWPQEIPGGWPYPQLVNITNAPLPSWWGHPAFPPNVAPNPIP